MERASGGELFDQLTTHNGPLPEAVVCGMMRQLAAGIGHCHQCGVAHRDIKLENALLNDSGVIKLIDFGLSHQYELDPKTGAAIRNHLIHGYCGSKSYAAPEVLVGQGYDGFQADIWSLGVSMFGLLNGFFPVDEAKASDWRYTKLFKAQELGRSSVNTIMGWYKKTPAHLSAKAVDLLDRMLSIDPRKRPSIEEVLSHPFITGKEVSSLNDSSSLHYRGAGMMPGSIMTDDMDIMDDGPVYRSIGYSDDEDHHFEMIMPGLTRQAAFGGVESSAIPLLQF